jgi:O-antigen/teichoic acid export membrane protein
MSGVWLACIASAGPDLVHWIFTDKWSPAVPTLMLYALALNFSVLSSVGAVSLNSLGLVNYATRVMVLRTVVNTALSVVLAKRIGYNGAAIAWVVAALLEGQLVYAGLGRGAWRRILGPVAWIAIPLLLGVLVGTIAARLALPLRPRAALTLAGTCIAYGGAAWLLGPPWLREATRRRLNAFVSGGRQGILPTAEAERA